MNDKKVEVYMNGKKINFKKRKYKKYKYVWIEEKKGGIFDD